MSSHNCVKDLRTALQNSNNKVANLQIQMADLKSRLKDHDGQVRVSHSDIGDSHCRTVAVKLQL